MQKRKIALMLSAVVASNFLATPLTTLANELQRQAVVSAEVNESKTALVKKFELLNSTYIDSYNEVFKLDNSKIKSISNNGGKYGGSSIEKAIDDNLNTHWETGTPNSAEFTNEVIIELEESTILNRIVYGARRDTLGKGFARNFEIYASMTEAEDDFQLVSTGSYSGSTGDFIEITFNPTEFKRIKFKFTEANQNWASAAEFMLYKEDSISNKIEGLFTDESKNVISDEFNSLDKLIALENEAVNHPLYETFKESIENAKEIINSKEIEATEAITNRFNLYETPGYDEVFKLDKSNIKSITNNGGHYASQTISKAIDGDLNTYWETNKLNGNNFNNEVEITFNEKVVLDRVVYGARQSDTKGFAEAFEIYASTTSEGDTYQLVSTGSHNRVNGLVEARFMPTEFKRIKFKYKVSNQDSATANEFWFYKEDDIARKVERLFTDSSMSTVSEEFNTLEKINALEEEVKTHPLYESFKGDLETARILIERGQVEAVAAKVSIFDYIDDKAYNDLFELDNSNIESIKNNGGHYSSRVITNAIDGDPETYWETNKSNSDSFTNEVEITFKDLVEINRIVYGARPGDAKGFAEGFEIYGSTAAKGDNYQLISTGSSKRVFGFIEAKFNTTEFKRLKFVFKNSNQNWATMSEIKFYKEDAVVNQIEDLFTDLTYSELKPQYKDINIINNLELQLENHPAKDKQQHKIDLAKKIINNEISFENTIFEAEQYGNLSKYGTDVLLFNSTGENYQSTGLYVQPGDKIRVYVEMESGKPLPVLLFSQNEGSFGNWAKGITLNPGENEIIVPEVYRDGNYQTDPKPGGAIYIENIYTPEEQGKAPVIRIEGAERFPLFKEGDNEEEFLEFLAQYKEKLDADDAAGTKEVLDIVEISSKRMLLAGTTTGAYDAYITKGVKPSETTTFWNETMEELFRYYGLDGSSPEHDPKEVREHIRFAQPYGYMYAYINHIGVQKDVMSIMLNPEAVKAGSWGFIHEIGHRMDVRGRIWGEVTNNMLSIQMGHIFGSLGHQVPYENDVYPNVAPNERLEDYINGHYFESLGLFWQLQIYDENFWPNVNKLYRERKPKITDQDHQRQVFIQYSSEVMNLDLSEYFRRHGFVANDETLAIVSKYEKPIDKIWYINDTSLNYDGQSVSEEAKVTINEIDEDAFGFTKLQFSSDIPEDVLLGYEIIRNDEVLGFTSTNTFTDNTLEENVKYEYKVIAYGKDLSTSKASEVLNYELERGYGDLDKSEWVATTNYLTWGGSPASNAIDKKYTKDNMFETRFPNTEETEQGITNPDELPYLLVDMKEVKDFEGFAFYNTASNSNGRGMIKYYNLYISNDGESFTKIVDNGEIPNATVKERKQILLDKIYSARYIKLECVESTKKDNIMTVMEFSPLKKEKDVVISKVEIVSENNKVELHGLDESIKLNVITKPNGATLNEIEWKVFDANTGEASNAVNISDDGVVTPNSTGKVEVVNIVAVSKDNSEVKDTIKITSYGSQLAQAGSYTEIQKNNWTATTNAVTDSKYMPNKAVDGKIGGSDIFQSGSQEGPKYLDIDMKDEYSFNGFGYHNKTNGHSNEGKVKKYNLYISNDGVNYTKIIDNGLVPRAAVKERKDILLDKSYTARYIRFECLETEFGDDKMAVLEFSPFTTEATIPVERIEVSSSQGKEDIYEINTVGQSLDLDIKAYPANASDINVNWTVQDSNGESIEEYVTIDENGVLSATGKAYAGSIKVIATSKSNGEVSGEASVLVVDNSSLNTSSTMKKFNLLNNSLLPSYDESYKANITGISNNGGKYGSSTIDKAIDGDTKTHWETGKPNSNSFINEVILTVDNKDEVLDTLVYATRQDGSKGKGFPLEYEIYASNLETGNTFRKIAEGTYTGNTGDFVEIKFEPTAAKRYKFVFKNAKEGWASASEFWLYKEDKLKNTLDDLFTDASKTEVKDKYKDILIIWDLEAKLEGHELKEYYANDIAIAKDIVSKKPELTIEDSIVIELGVEIENIAGEYSAIDFEDGDITSNVIVEHNVNFNKTGVYEVKYSITDSHYNTVTASRTVKVIDMEDNIFLSDIDWKSARAGYGQVRKDLASSGNSIRLTDDNGDAVVFEKGIGTHSYSEIVYDLSDKDYEFFTSYVGVDRHVYNSQGSVSFEVYLDNKKVYDSGLMLANDPMKFVKVSLEDAKELKLVVTQGGNENWSDHANFADAKLYYINMDAAEVNRVQLDKLISEIGKLDSSIYTEETFENLLAVLQEVNNNLSDGYNQVEVDSLYTTLKEAYDKLVIAVDLNEIVNIPDESLKILIKKTLKLDKEDITIGDMYKLTSLEEISGYVSNLEGLQYAKNLESINLEWNEVADISPIRELKNLKNINLTNQFIESNMVYNIDGKIKMKENIIDINGEKLSPKEIVVEQLDDIIASNVSSTVEDDFLVIDSSILPSGISEIILYYESLETNFSAEIVFYIKK